MATDGRAHSPNHLDKRRQIVEAAKAILLGSGPGACSSREIAKSTGLNKGLIHYYFNSVDEIVDAAMADLLEGLTARLRAVGDAHADPSERFWAVVEEYLAAFGDESELTLLWFEWWTRKAREGNIGEVQAVQDGLIELLAELLVDVGGSTAATRARALFSYVIGALVRQSIHRRSFDELRPEVADLCGVELVTDGD